MAFYFPQIPASSAAENRSRGATIGSAIGMVTCAAAVAVAATYTLKIEHLYDARLPDFPRDHTGSHGFIAIAAVVGLFGIVACALALRTNGWRISAAVLGFISAAGFGMIVLSFLGLADATRYDWYPESDGFGPYADGPGGPFRNAVQSADTAHLRQAYEQSAILAAILGLLALVAAILLVTGNNNGWYTRNQVRVMSYAVVPPGFVLPQPAAPGPRLAGWYPADEGRLRWWDGGGWTDHFHEPGPPS